MDERIKKAIDEMTVFRKENKIIQEITQDAAGSMCGAAINCFNYGYICGMRDERKKKGRRKAEAPMKEGI